MYSIKTAICDKLLKSTINDGFPNLKVIKDYKDGIRKAQENTVRALASHLNEVNWKDLIHYN